MTPEIYVRRAHQNSMSGLRLAILAGTALTVASVSASPASAQGSVPEPPRPCGPQIACPSGSAFCKNGRWQCELCDGVDGNGDGIADEGNDALCNGPIRSGCGVGACLRVPTFRPGPFPEVTSWTTRCVYPENACDDGMSCTRDACTAGGACSHETVPACSEPTDSFHAASLYYGGPALGTRPLHIVLWGTSDAAHTLTRESVERTVFGPGYPNMVDQFKVASHGAFSWSRGTLLGPTFAADDPDTVLLEHRAADIYPPLGPGGSTFLYARLSTGTGFLGAVGSGGSTTALVPDIEAVDEGDPVTLKTVALSRSDGRICNRDTVAFKTGSGHFLRTSGTALKADGVSKSNVASQFRIGLLRKAPGNVDALCVEGGDTVTLESRSAAGRFVRFAGGAFTVDGSVTTAAQLTMTRSWRSAAQLDREVYAALATRVDFPAFDVNRDGVVTTDEFHLLVVELRICATCGSPSWGKSRNEAGAFRPAGSSVTVNLFHSFIGEDSWLLSTGTHEVSHQLGAMDIYGASGLLNWPLSFMAGSGRDLQSLDGYHKMRLGWTRAIAHAMGSSGKATLQIAQARGSHALEKQKRPIIFYDTARYDVRTGQGEYFLLEYRKASTSTSYDMALDTSWTYALEGLALWQVATDAAGNLFTIPALTGEEHFDSSLNHLGAPIGPGTGYERGGWALWTKDAGWLRPRYRDGTLANIELRVLDDTNRDWIRIEWRTPSR